MNKTTMVIAIIGLVGALFIAGYFLNSKQTSKQPSTEAQSKKLRQESYKNITSQELNQMLANKDFFFVNVHIPYEGEIENTDSFVPYNEIESNLGKLPKGKNEKIVLYCRSGRMSAIAAQKLADLGYTNVFNHLGGMIDWEQSGYKVTSIQ